MRSVQIWEPGFLVVRPWFSEPLNTPSTGTREAHGRQYFIIGCTEQAPRSLFNRLWCVPFSTMEATVRIQMRERNENWRRASPLLLCKTGVPFSLTQDWAERVQGLPSSLTSVCWSHIPLRRGRDSLSLIGRWASSPAERCSRTDTKSPPKTPNSLASHSLPHISTKRFSSSSQGCSMKCTLRSMLPPQSCTIVSIRLKAYLSLVSGALSRCGHSAFSHRR